MTDDPKDTTVKVPKFDALREALATARALYVIGDKELPVAQANFFVQQIQAYSTLALAQRMDTLSNDVAAIANMIEDAAQEREAEANRMSQGGNNG